MSSKEEEQPSTTILEQELRDIHVLMRLILSINLISCISTTIGIFSFLKIVYSAVFLTMFSLIGALVVILFDGPFRAFVVTHFETSSFNTYFTFVENNIEKAANYMYGMSPPVSPPPQEEEEKKTEEIIEPISSLKAVATETSEEVIAEVISQLLSECGSEKEEEEEEEEEKVTL